MNAGDTLTHPTHGLVTYVGPYGEGLSEVQKVSGVIVVVTDELLQAAD